MDVKFWTETLIKAVFKKLTKLKNCNSASLMKAGKIWKTAKI